MCGRQSSSICASRAGEAEQAATGFWTETLGWGERTREDGHLRVKNLGSHVKGMGSSRVGEIEFFSCSHVILS